MPNYYLSVLYKHITCRVKTGGAHTYIAPPVNKVMKFTTPVILFFSINLPCTSILTRQLNTTETNKKFTRENNGILDKGERGVCVCVCVLFYSTAMYVGLTTPQYGRKEMFYIMTHSTLFIYGYMAWDIW